MVTAMRRRPVRRVTVSRNAQDASGRPGLWLFLRLCTWEGITPVEHPTIRLALSLWRQGLYSRAAIVARSVGLDLQAQRD